MTLTAFLPALDIAHLYFWGPASLMLLAAYAMVRAQAPESGRKGIDIDAD